MHRLVLSGETDLNACKHEHGHVFESPTPYFTLPWKEGRKEGRGGRRNFKPDIILLVHQRVSPSKIQSGVPVHEGVRNHRMVAGAGIVRSHLIDSQRVLQSNLRVSWVLEGEGEPCCALQWRSCGFQLRMTPKFWLTGRTRWDYLGARSRSLISVELSSARTSIHHCHAAKYRWHRGNPPTTKVVTGGGDLHPSQLKGS